MPATAPAKREPGRPSLLAKLLQGPSADWSKDEALDAITVWRQVLGLLIGLVWGYIPMPGLLGVAGFIALNVLLTLLLYKNVMGVDDDEWENASQDMLQEGLPYSMSIFLITWVLSYTMIHT